VDDKKQYDPHYRILAVVYVNDTNLNEKLVKEGYAEIMDIPPWKAEYTHSPSPTPITTPIPGFEILFAMIGVVAVVYLIRRRGQV
jgi:PGF-CTERM protein